MGCGVWGKIALVSRYPFDSAVAFPCEVLSPESNSGACTRRRNAGITVSGLRPCGVETSRTVMLTTPLRAKANLYG